MKRIYILLVLIIFSCKPKQMKITQVEDIYAKQNGEIPNENIFLIENFSNDREGIIKILNYAKDSISKMKPFKKEHGYCQFIFNRNDVTFDDGYYSINAKKSIMLSIDSKEKYFNGISVHSNNSLSYTLKGTSDIFIDYGSFNLSVFKTFLDVIEKDRDKIIYNYSNKEFEVNGKKLESFKQDYQLINSRNFTIECQVIYLDKRKFKIEFPNYK